MTTIKEHLIMWPALLVLVGLMCSLIYGISTMLPKEAVYDCKIAEISPDIPVAAKEECRRLRSQK
jgi:hypothetical protein